MQSTCEEESPYGLTRWPNYILYFGHRIGDDKLFRLTMMREKFGKESLIQKIGSDQK